MVSTDGRTATERYNIIPRHTLLAGYKKSIPDWHLFIRQTVCNDIACNCIPIVRITFIVRTHFILIAFLRILIAYLRKYAAYL